MAKNKEEFCIMPNSNIYFTERRPNTARHEVFFGNKNRQKSIDLGLVVFLPHNRHNIGLYGVHCKYGHELDIKLKKIGQETYMNYYGKTEEEFIKEFGMNYL